MSAKLSTPAMATDHDEGDINSNSLRLFWLRTFLTLNTVLAACTGSQGLEKLAIHDNPFFCDCEIEWFISWADDHPSVVQGWSDGRYQCNTPPRLHGTDLPNFHPDCASHRDLYACAITTSFLLLYMLFAVLVNFCSGYFAYLWFRVRLRLRGYEEIPEQPQQFRYDAFVAYSSNDEAWVSRVLSPMLERRPPRYRLCIGERDFVGGVPILHNISNAVETSRKTVCIITRSFLRSNWCNYELQMSQGRHHLFDPRRVSLVLVFLENIPDRVLERYPLLNNIVNRDTYLRWPNNQQHLPLFWARLLQALGPPLGDDLQEDDVEVPTPAMATGEKINSNSLRLFGLRMFLTLSTVLALCTRTQGTPCTIVNKTATCSNGGLTQIPSNLPHNLTNLDLSNNDIQAIRNNSFSSLHFLEVLNFGRNNLSVIEPAAFYNLSRLKNLAINDNPFFCDCEIEWFISWAADHSSLVQGWSDGRYQCNTPPDLHDTDLRNFHPDCASHRDLYACAITTSFLLLYMLFAVLVNFCSGYFAYLWFRVRLRLRGYEEIPEQPQQFRYDAFVAYSSNDEAWVSRVLSPMLERRPPRYRLCIGERDFVGGVPILHNISNAVETSRKTVCIITRSFLRSNWCNYELQMSQGRHHLFDPRRVSLVLVFLENIPDRVLERYPLLNNIVNRDTYLRWPNNQQYVPLFWARLLQALGPPLGDDLQEDDDIEEDEA
ncbi:TLR1 [Branchiostoma lanceolatum]|uniref:TLR1 protein n=1 Tax=Branchiostoma lanceolatum TaxID=7740 RepID=A0A8J9VHA4_BRALA|nr:TLR1 [Branchiostoma lanceolatum]